MQDEVLKVFRTELEEITSQGTEIWVRQERARQVRFNDWAGQSPDGRKHGDAIDGEALPFEGAPDNRIPLVDTAINEKVMLARRGFFRSLVQAKPVEPGDAARAANINTLLSWLRDRAMREELEVEVALSAQYMFGDDPGVVILEVQWLRDLGLKRTVLSFEQLALMFATGASSPEEAGARVDELGGVEPELLAEFSDLATNPERAVEWVEWLGSMFPGATRKALRRVARELKAGESAELPVPAIRENRPSVRALRLFDEVFLPLGTVDVQRARSIHRREWLTEVELRERVQTLGWSAEWVEQVIERGRGQSVLSDPLRFDSWNTSSVSAIGPGRAVNERDHLFEVWWSYRREADELGVPGINCMVWNGSVVDLPASYTVAEYPHGRYPFVLGTRERLGRQTTDSRGLTVPLATHQLEIKVQRDARGAHVQMLASPPIKTRIRQGASELIIGPNAQIPVQKMDDFDVVQLPNFLQNSVEMEQTTRAEAIHYAGMMGAEVDPNRVSMIQQDEVDNFLSVWKAAFVQVLALAQGYFSAVELARITGDAGAALNLNPDDIRGGYDVTLEIDARDLNMEFAMKKMEAYGKLRSYDASGRLDSSAFIEWAARALDPILAARTLTPQGEVTAKMVDEEQGNVAKMSAGIEPAMNEDGVSNPGYRLQTMISTIMGSPRLVQQAATDELFRALVENRQKYLEQQVAQEQNKVVGRLGTKPLQEGGGMMGGMALPVFIGQNAARGV